MSTIQWPDPIYSIYQGDAWPVPDVNADAKPSLSSLDEPRSDLVSALAELTKAMTRQNQLLEALIQQYDAVLVEMLEGQDEDEPTQYLDGTRI